MPPDPKKPIEELLEASARARRAEFGADPKMPNPMRARLQDEVARRARDRAPAPRKPWFAISWPRLALGTAFASLMAAVSVFWWHVHEVSESGTSVALEQKTSAPEISRAESANYPAPATARQAPAETDKLEAQESGAGHETKTLPLAAAASATQPAIQNFSQSAALEAGFKQQFSQSAANKMTAGAAQRAQTPKLLDNFQVEQNGRDIRVVDGDGSTYEGQIEQLGRTDARNLVKAKTRDAAPAAPAAHEKRPATAKERSAGEMPNDGFYFRASGYNASLKKSVVFEGNYIVDSPPAAKDRAALADKSEPQLKARIIGTAKVSGEPPVPVEAVSVPAK
jgi:hypothetical protein